MNTRKLARKVAQDRLFTGKIIEQMIEEWSLPYARQQEMEWSKSQSKHRPMLNKLASYISLASHGMI
jgi:hypothetical protein